MPGVGRPGRLDGAPLVRSDDQLAVPGGATAPAARGVRDTLAIYLALTKPRIIQLLLVTTVPSMVIAADGWPGTWLVVATLIGGAMSAASANTFNNYLDRDIDREMVRTRERPLARGVITPGAALRFGIILGIAGFVWLALLVNLLAALLASSAILFYVFVYTLGLKRKTNQAVVIGGAAGCVPVLAGWAAVTGRIEPVAWVLFAIIFYWTPPHFWALAMKYREDYASVGLPMLTVTHGNDETTRHILLYSYLLVAVTLLYFPIAQAGAIYLTSTALLGAGWLWLAHRLRRERTVTTAMQLFHYSIAYLALVFAAAAIDTLA